MTVRYRSVVRIFFIINPLLEKTSFTHAGGFLILVQDSIFLILVPDSVFLI